jgi:hypothetical protein
LNVRDVFRRASICFLEERSQYACRPMLANFSRKAKEGGGSQSKVTTSCTYSAEDDFFVGARDAVVFAGLEDRNMYGPCVENTY